MLERSYLETISERKHFEERVMPLTDQISWMRIDRLPVSPLRIDDYDLLSRWQGVLASLHAWHEKLIFLLQRRNGQTHLYIGVQCQNATDGANKIRSALVSSMPGIDLHYLDGNNYIPELLELNRHIVESCCAGVVTGIPSFRQNSPCLLSLSLLMIRR